MISTESQLPNKRAGWKNTEKNRYIDRKKFSGLGDFEKYINEHGQLLGR